MLAAISASANCCPASAASRAVAVSTLVVTEPLSRLLMARNASAISSVTESKMSVMTSATPFWDLRLTIDD